ncbi:mechanosensitive ion channel domain-containing protein [Roseobacter ponti]|uniref:Mechanosensitive ion channel family protein n=1 Tax=Roseobacter ponti TaxID=1891787 RepID=A0A858SUE5_9RHOB|nr:mechanosensitive ion channel domain-containing protein [Roseobacter ponti]QJF51627.1 mechanosensitive ion channel family protein [Roseobacter ponti]
MRRVLLVLSLFFCVGLTDVSHAQDSTTAEPSESTQQFESVVTRAQEAVGSGAASAEALTRLRTELDDLRSQVSVISESGSVEARTIEAQIEALGPPPLEGETEPEAIASRRKALAENLAVANQPVREARERLNQIELLIRELDGLIRQKDTTRLIERFPSILWPGTLTVASKELKTLGSEAMGEVQRSFDTNDYRENQIARTILALGLVLFSLLTIFVVRPVLIRFFDRRFEETQTSGRYLWALLSNLANILVPAVGAVALGVTVPALGIQSRLTDFLGQYVVWMLLLIISANWLGHTVFSPDAPNRRLVNLDDQEAMVGLRICQMLGIVEAVEILVEVLALGLIQNAATISVLAVPILSAAAFLLWSLAGLLHRVVRKGTVADSDSAALDSLDPAPAHGQKESNRSLIKALVFLLRAVALITVPLVLAGFVPMARHISDATAMSLGLLGFALFLYSLIMGSFRTFSRLKRRDQAEMATTLPLLPIVVSSLLFLCTVPMLAIFWGARTADVAEVWRLLTVGVQIGDVQISLGVVVSLMLVFFLGTVATRWMQHGLRETVLPRTRLDAGARNALVTGVGYVGLSLSALIAIAAAGLSLSSLAVVAGALSLGIGFGMQTIVSNFVSGIILLVERPIAEGDWIEVSGHAGIVKKIAVRSTQISTFDKHDVIVPNQDLIGGTVKNMTLSSRMGRLIVPIGIAYGSDIEQAREILEKAAKDDNTVLGHPPPAVLFRGLGDSSLDFELRCYLKNVDTMLATQSDLLFRIYVDLSRAGIEIPFPQRDVHVKNVSEKTAPPTKETEDTQVPSKTAGPDDAEEPLEGR